MLLSVPVSRCLLTSYRKEWSWVRQEAWHVSKEMHGMPHTAVAGHCRHAGAATSSSFPDVNGKRQAKCHVVHVTTATHFTI